MFRDEMNENENKTKKAQGKKCDQCAHKRGLQDIHRTTYRRSPCSCVSTLLLSSEIRSDSFLNLKFSGSF